PGDSHMNRNSPPSSATSQAVSRRVMVWRYTVLPGAETYIRNQVESYSKWNPILLGAARSSSPNSRPNDRILFDDLARHRLETLIFRVTDFSPRLVRIATALRPNLIHAHFAMDGMRMRRLARRLHTPL